MKKVTLFLIVNVFLFLNVNVIAQQIDLIKDFNPSGSGYPQNLKVINNKLYFSANDGTNGGEWWESDGTTAGTKLVMDINPGTGSSFPSSFTLFNNKIYFAANNGTNGSELWVSDETIAGTKMLKDLRAGVESSYPKLFTIYKGKLYFAANENVYNTELFVSDGTETGTSMFKRFNPSNSSSISNLKVLNDQLYFSADDGSGKALWTTNGTDAGTTKIKNLIFEDLVVYNNKLYFRASDDLHGSELWESDGTEAGTKLTVDINAGVTSSAPRGMTVYNGLFYFSANNDANNFELWASDGTAAGTKMVKEINLTGGSGPGGFTVLNNLLYFTATDGVNKNELWVTDGTEAGTRTVEPLNEGSDANYISEITSFNNNLFFRANTAATGHELFGTSKSLSIDNELFLQTKLYPNPVESNFEVTTNQVIDKIIIYNLVGQELKSENFSSTKIKMSLKDIKSGIYITKIITANSSKTIKILKQ